MASELPRHDARQEDNLLIEAVSLLVQRQREIESQISEQTWQAEERATTTERRYAELEARLASIEDELNRLIRVFEPGRSDAAGSERLARLREQVEGLKSGGDARPSRIAARPTGAATDPRGSGGIWQFIGATPQDRFGSVLIALGVVAVLYAIFSQLSVR